MDGAVGQGPHEEGTFEQRLDMGTSRMEVGNWETCWSQREIWGRSQHSVAVKSLPSTVYPSRI